MKTFIEDMYTDVLKKEDNGTCCIVHVRTIIEQSWNYISLIPIARRPGCVDLCSNFYYYFHRGQIRFCTTCADPEKELPNFIHSIITGCSHYYGV